MAQYKIKPLVVGMNRTDQGVMTYMNEYGKKIPLPIYVFAILGGDKKILIDSGLEQVMETGKNEETGLPIYSFEDALESIGWKPEDVDIIIHTHLHNDHCENDYKCENATIYVQKEEMKFLQDPHPLDHRIFPDILDDVKEIVELDGDQKIMDGIEVLLTPGHTPGGQSIVVDTKEGRALITGFCSNEKNFPKGRPAIVPGVHLDVRDAYDSVQKVIDFKADILIPLHSVEAGLKEVG